MEPLGRTLRRRLLGRELKRARELAGLSVRTLAPLVKLQPGTISKIENGRQAILPRNVLLIGQACGLAASDVKRLVVAAEQEERETWWLPYGDAVPTWFRDYVDLESDATSLQTYSAELVDGLLQTAAYAEAVARVTEPEFTEEQMKRAVELREARQARLASADGPRLHVVMNEVALLRPFGSAEVMREQAAHLVEVADRGDARIQILPISVGGHPAVKGGFTILRFGAGLQLLDSVYLENENDGVWQDQPSDVERYSTVFHRVAEMALSPVASREALITLAG